MNKNLMDKKAVYVFALPALILFTVFVVYPMIPQVQMSFLDHDGFSSDGFVGFSNYVEILTDGDFWHSVMNTWIITFFSVFIAIPISLIFALFMNYDNSFSKNVFKFSSVFPAVLTVTVIAQMWVAIYEPEWGLINSTLDFLGLDMLKHSWLTDLETVIPAVSFAYLWQYIGLNSLIMYTGIKSIPNSYYEAAIIDGASFFKASIHITIPLLSNVLKYVLVVSTLGSLAQFAHIRVMTSGGPGSHSRTMIYEMYNYAFTRNEYGVGSAVAVIFIIQCLIVTLFINKILKQDSVQF